MEKRYKAKKSQGKEIMGKVEEIKKEKEEIYDKMKEREGEIMIRTKERD